MSPTDSEEGKVPVEGPPDESELEVVASPVDPTQPGVGRLAVERRIDIGPAREYDAVQAVEDGADLAGRAGGQGHGDRPRPHHGADIVLPQAHEPRLPFVFSEGDPEERADHMRSGTGMPSRSRRACIWRMKVSTTRVRKARRSSSSACSTEYWGFW